MRDSRTIEAARKRIDRPLDKRIKYYELTPVFMAEGSFRQKEMEKATQ